MNPIIRCQLRNLSVGKTAVRLPVNGTQRLIVAPGHIALALRLKAMTSQENWFLQSLSVVLGCFRNDRANAETFYEDTKGKWIKTGDEAGIRRAPFGNEYIFIFDRIKRLIKVKLICKVKLGIIYCQ